MLSPVVSFCVYWAEMLVAYTYFSSIFERRASVLRCILSGFVLFSIGSVLNLLFGNHTTVNLCSFLSMTVLFAYLCFSGKTGQLLFYSLVFIVLNAALEAIIISASSYVTGNAFLDYNHNLPLLLFEAFSSKGLCYLLVLIIVKIINPAANTSRVPGNFLVYPVVSTFCLFVFWRICAQPWCPSQIQLLMAGTGGCLFMSSIFLFITYTRQAERDSEAVAVKSELARLQTEQSYYQILDQQNQQLLLYAHDARKHLAAIQALNDDPRIDSYVEALSQQLANYSKNCHSGNKLLDVMIGKYTTDCEIRGIHFEHDVKLCNLSQLNDIDLVAILGNLMDNAVTAAEQSSAKTVSLNTIHRNSYSVIIITNSCDIPPRLSGKSLLSTKIDAKNHGFGLKSVAKAVTKYRGDYDWEYDSISNAFTVTVMLED